MNIIASKDQFYKNALKNSKKGENKQLINLSGFGKGLEESENKLVDLDEAVGNMNTSEERNGSLTKIDGIDFNEKDSTPLINLEEVKKEQEPLKSQMFPFLDNLKPEDIASPDFGSFLEACGADIGSGSFYDAFKFTIDKSHENGGIYDKDPNTYTVDEAKEKLKNSGKEWVNDALKSSDKIAHDLVNFLGGKEATQVGLGITNLVKGGAANAFSPLVNSINNAGGDRKIYDPFEEGTALDIGNEVLEGLTDGLENFNNELKKVVGFDPDANYIDPKITQVPPSTELSPIIIKNVSDIKKLTMSTDFAPNIYDVFFEIKGKDLGYIRTLTKHTGEVHEDPIVLSARIENIDIPGISEGITEVPFCGSSILMPTNKFSDPHQSTFTIRADQDLFWINVFNKISGNDVYGEGTKFHDDVISAQEAKLGVSSLGELPQPFLDKIVKNGDYTFNIYVRWLPSWGNPQSSDLPLDSLLKSEGNTLYDRRLYKFEGVRLLGTGNPISFKRDDANTQSFTYDFIYRKLYLKYL